jgi:4-hydroxyphenylacetate 3-monooxygenase
MSIRNGAQYLQGLRDHAAEVWLGNERIGDVTTHPALARGAHSVARLYDLQQDPALMAEMTYTLDGTRHGLSHIQPKTIADLENRSRMMLHWARSSGGMMGRSPDYLNCSIAACAAAAGFFEQNDKRHGANIRAYYAHVRDNDLALTHTLLGPQKNRARGTENPDDEIAARIVKETSSGLVISGARILATLGPLSDELVVFPSTVRQQAGEKSPLAFAFAIPSNTRGLKYICRESLDIGRSTFDHPLGARFEEMDAVVVFDNVLVPWERVFLKHDAALCNQLYGATHAVVHMMQQVACKNVAKAEFLLGIACLVVEALGSGEFPHVHEKIAECICDLELMKACLRAGEVDAKVDEWGLMCPARAPLDVARNVFPKMYPRLREILQQLGSSSLMMTPPETVFDSPVAADVDRYLVSANLDARQRVQLFRLAWDVACSSFGSRQELYERFFFGDPVRMATALFHNYHKEPAMDRARAMLNRIN